MRAANAQANSVLAEKRNETNASENIVAILGLALEMIAEERCGKVIQAFRYLGFECHQVGLAHETGNAPRRRDPR